MIGDLLHGRTVHSKVDGLRVYDTVYVDLIAPDIISLPLQLKQKMEEYGYIVRTFDSIDDYLGQTSIATIRYFTRVQLERMGEDIQKEAHALRQSITCTRQHIEQIEKQGRTIKFYHPLPRHKEFPVVPTFLDTTSYN